MRTRQRHQHLLLTRYNLAIDDSRKNLDSAWLAERLQLFQTYCLTSVLAQSDQEFQWLILCDGRTAPSDLLAIKHVIPINAQLVLLDSPLDDTDLQQLFTANNISISMPTITSRLDSDDSIGSEYIFSINSLARATRKNTAFNFPLGFQLHDGDLYLMPDFSSPFMSLFEPRGLRSTILDGSHREVSSRVAIKQVWRCPQWLQVVHDTNIDNRVRGVRVPRPAAGTHFAQVIATLKMPPERRRGLPLAVTRSLVAMLLKVLRQTGTREMIR